jgi:hypothetical protein
MVSLQRMQGRWEFARQTKQEHSRLRIQRMKSQGIAKYHVIVGKTTSPSGIIESGVIFIEKVSRS